ncbi:MAG TPA: nicotinate-nucleotide--dimethylbenzimidazole phosphoribosyltransferase, partial [Jatrophihabitantaceae bacterium]|nr:nicotinate-nucleotide--dimethylbenzimidazole phosphoribosyltransferase [Jatrophihabitantaceae bacterium]
ARSETCTDTDAEAAVRFGAQLADDEVDRGADLVVLTVSGSLRAAAVLVAVLTDTEPVKVLPRSAATPPGEWMTEAEAVRDARRAAFGLRGDPLALLDSTAAPNLAAATGFLLRAAARRTPMLVEGTAATAAGLVAFDVQPRSARWWRPADSPDHPAARIALTRMALDPVLSLGTDRSDGTIGLLAAGIVRAAAG